jgi:hypothetical protein
MEKEESVRRTERTVSRRDFLRFGGAGLAGAALLGTAACGGSQQGGGEVVRFLTSTPETTSQERVYRKLQVDGFNEQYPKYTLEREAIPGSDLHDLKDPAAVQKPPQRFYLRHGTGFRRGAGRCRAPEPD